MDMWEPYANSVRANLADADKKIVFDRYHIMTHMGKAVDTVRKTETPGPAAEGNDTLVAPSTSSCTHRRTSPSATPNASPRCAAPTSRRHGPGPSKRTCAGCGTTAAPGQRSTGVAGTSGPRTHGSSPSSRWPR